MAIKTPAQLRSKCQPRESCPRPKAPRIVSLQSQGFLPTPGVRQDPMFSCGVGGQPFFPQALRPGQVSSPEPPACRFSCKNIGLGAGSPSGGFAADQLAVRLWTSNFLYWASVSPYVK